MAEATPTGGTRVEQALSRLVFRPAWLLFGAITIAWALGLTIPREYQWLPLIASIVLLGLPHGAVDHLALPRLYGDGLTPRWIAIVVGLYAVLGGAYLLVWFLAPAVAFVIFILITWAHWGQGELYPLLRLAGVDHLPGPWHRVGTVLVRGALPMIVPLVAFPDQYQLVAEELIGLYSPQAIGTIAVVFEPAIRGAIGIGVAGLIAVTLGVGGLRAAQVDALDGWAIDAGETLLLVAFFATVPPILAIGIYFCFWHALRHISRLVAVDEGARAALSAKDWTQAAWRFIRDAAPLTAASVVLLGGLYLISPRSPTTMVEFVALYLVLIAVLTLPHVVVVSWMDYRQRIFDPANT